MSFRFGRFQISEKRKKKLGKKIDGQQNLKKFKF